MIKAKCENCGKEIRCKQEHIGRKAKCPNCNQIITIAAPPLNVQEILDFPDAPEPLTDQQINKIIAGTPGIGNVPDDIPNIQPRDRPHTPKQRKSSQQAQVIGTIITLLVFAVCLVACLGIFSSGGSGSKSTVQGNPQEKLDAYMALINAADSNALIVNSVGVKKGSSYWQATITVQNAWHFQPYQVRLQTAQNLWAGWAQIASPQEPDSARISIVDLNGNEVGGSRALAGSLIWVQEQ